MGDKRDEHQTVVTVFGVLKRQERILMIERGRPPDQGRRTVPGGHKRLGESLEDACRREIREESGLELGVLKSLGFMEVQVAGETRDFISFYFLAESFSGSCRSGPEGQLAWMTRAEALAHPETHPAFGALAAHFFAGRPFAARASVAGPGLQCWSFQIEDL